MSTVGSNGAENSPQKPPQRPQQNSPQKPPKDPTEGIVGGRESPFLGGGGVGKAGHKQVPHIPVGKTPTTSPEATPTTSPEATPTTTPRTDGEKKATLGSGQASEAPRNSIDYTKLGLFGVDKERNDKERK